MCAKSEGVYFNDNAVFFNLVATNYLPNELSCARNLDLHFCFSMVVCLQARSESVNASELNFLKAGNSGFGGLVDLTVLHV